VLGASATEPDRGAWHEAMAATVPDEDVAAALDEAAAKARARGGLSAEAAALERAARLTPDAEARARRLFRAGLAADACARFEQAEELFAEASELTSDHELRADAVARRSYLVFNRGDFEAAIELANSEAEHAAPATAARLLTSSGVIHALMHALDIPAARRTAERAAELAGGEEASNDPDIRHMLAWAWELSGLREQALELIRECAGRVEVGTVLAVDVANRFLFLEDYDSAQELFDRVVAHDREVGALQFLGYALDMRSLLDARSGCLAPAYALALEALQLTESLGTDTATAACLARLAHLEAVLGRSADAVEHGRRSLQISERRGDHWNIVRARTALGLEALARGDAAGTSSGWRRRPRCSPPGDIACAIISGSTATSSKPMFGSESDMRLNESWPICSGTRRKAGVHGRLRWEHAVVRSWRRRATSTRPSRPRSSLRPVSQAPGSAPEQSSPTASDCGAAVSRAQPANSCTRR